VSIRDAPVRKREPEVTRVASEEEGVLMIVAKKSKPKKAVKKRPSKPRDWRAGIRRYFTKVPTVDAVYVFAGETIHVYTIVKELREKYYKGLLEQEGLFEKAYPEFSFDFHTRAHQGRDQSTWGSWGWELVYLR
jgi:hypothetical protein